MYKLILPDLHVVVFESIMVLTFFECWIQLAPHFSISFFACLLMFFKYFVFVGQVLYGRVSAERLLLSICGAECSLDSTGSGLLLLVGLLMWNVNCGWQTLCGEGDGTCREGSDDGNAVHVCITVQVFLSISFSFPDCPKDLGKLESVECFFTTSYRFERLRWLLVWKDLFLPG